MSEIASIAAEPREKTGTGAARAARRAGRIPAVMYGAGKDPVLISVEPMALDQWLKQPGFFIRQFDVKIDGGSHRVLAREVQFHPVSDTPMHVDFLRVSADTRINVEIPVFFENEELSPGLKRGGVLNVVRREVEVVCAVGNIPERFVVDLEGLEIGDSIHISMVDLPAGVTPTIADRDFTIATVAAPTVVREEAAAEQAEAAAELEEGELLEEEALAEGEAPEEGAEGEEKAEEKPEGEKES